MMELTVLLILLVMGANTVMLVMCLTSLRNIADNLTTIIGYADDEAQLEDATQGPTSPQGEIVAPGNTYMPDRLADLLRRQPPTDLTNGTFEGGSRPLGPPPDASKP